ncbi:hypothetical protein KBZ21_41500, partial [Streptomyces sp. A73]|nr:hypothetical protein [Streptomyces sp. A73]
MNVGDTFRYHDGIKVTVTSIDRFTKFSEYDSKPSAGESKPCAAARSESGGGHVAEQQVGQMLDAIGLTADIDEGDM